MRVQLKGQLSQGRADQAKSLAWRLLPVNPRVNFLQALRNHCLTDCPKLC